MRKAIISSALALVVGAAGGMLASTIASKVRSAKVRFDDVAGKSWPPGFERATTPGRAQPLYVRTSPSPNRPLVISFHTWSGGFDQQDELAPEAAARDWNYIHPHLQGSNNSPAACLSADVMADVRDAYAWAEKNMKFDSESVVVVGVSGGAYTALGSWMQGTVPAKAYLAWAPITDLRDWRQQSMARKLKYSADVERCAAVDGIYSDAEAIRRSPLHMPAESATKFPELHLFAGIRDGFDGSVPISHSILFYDRMAQMRGASSSELVTSSQMASLLTMATPPSTSKKIDDRSVYLHRAIPGLSLTVFDGNHEMLVRHTANEIDRLTGVSAPAAGAP